MNGGRKKNSVGWVEARLFNFRPAFFVAIFLAFGICHAFAVQADGASWAWAFLLLPIFLSFVFSKNVRKTAVATFSLLLAYAIGFGLFSWEYTSFVSSKVYEGEFFVTGTVTEYTAGEEQARVVLSDITVDGKTSEYKLVAYLSYPFFKSVSLSDRIAMVGTVRTPSAEDGEYNGGSVADKERYVLYYPESVTAIREEFDLFRTVRERLTERIERGMNPTAAGLTKALILGDTSGIEADLLGNIRKGGIAHLFAVSGLHIAALYAFCRFFTDKTKLFYAPAFVRFLFVAVIVLFYGGVCGYSASVVRAISMCLVSYFCKLTFFNDDLLERVGVAAVVALCISPSQLFAVGFQLSFLAMLGVAMGAGRIFRLLKGDAKWLNRLLEGRQVRIERANGRRRRSPLGLVALSYRSFARLFSATLAAQIATAPVVLNTFGYLSGWGVLLNFLFIPLIGAVFSGLLSLTFLAALLPIGAAKILLFLPSVACTLVSLLFETVNFSSFLLVGKMGSATIISYYLLAVLLTDKINLGRRRLVYVALGTALFALCAWLG